MALLFVDSFDHYTTRVQLLNKYDIWQLDAGNTIDIAAGLGRSGTDALKINDYTGASTPWENGPFVALGGNKTTLIAGVAVNFSGTPSSAASIFQFWDDSSLQCYLRVNTDMTLSFMNGDKTTVLGTSGSAITTGTYYYIECKVTIGSSGSFEVRVNEVAFLTGTGVDTQESGNNTISDIQLGGMGPVNNDTYHDDYYICDTTGANNNDFLGDTHIEARFPNNPGEFSDWGLVDTGLTNTLNYQSVDEATPDEDVTFNVGSAIGQRDTFFFGAPTLDVPVYGVVLQTRLRKASAGERNMQAILYSGGSAADGDALYFGSNYRYHRQIYETDVIQGSPWTQYAIGTAQFGYEIIPAP